MLLQSEAMVAKKLLVDDKITASVKQICLLGVICKVANITSGEKFCFLEKHLLPIFEFCASSNILVFLRAADWLTTNFLGMYCYIHIISLINFVQVAPVTVVPL